MSEEPEERQQDSRPEVEVPNLSRPVPPGPNKETPLPESGPGKDLPKQKRAQPSRSWGRGPRWFLIFLILFLLGGVAAIYLLYVPLRDQTDALRASLEAANQRVADLEMEIDSLQTFQDENDELTDEMKQAELHIALLSARVDVATARVAVLNDQPAEAQALLSQTDATLEQAAAMVAPEQRELVLSMQQRLQLAIAGIEADTNAALSDLDVLATNLLQLENTLFMPR